MNKIFTTKWKRLVILLFIPATIILSVLFLLDRDDSFLKDPGVPQMNYKNRLSSLQRPLRLMPVGDSITHASSATGNYRCILWNRLKSVGTFDFVGNMNGMVFGGKKENCDNDHEGHAGWRSDQVLEVIHQSAVDNKPDIALIHLGTNDLTKGNSTGFTAYAISQIIYQLQKQNPLLVVFVAGIIPDFRQDDFHLTVELNRRIRNMARKITTEQNPVLFIDHFEGFTESDAVDRLHPNDAGALKISDKWGEAIEKFLTPPG